MPNFSVVLMILYFCVLIGVGLYVLTLLSRFVSAHERIAAALERRARHHEHEGRGRE
jgi:hypothetical protein